MPPREKYRVVRKLDSGGMAEVFIGEAESIEGFKKRVAIKRVLPHLAENKKFLAMFLDEARLSLRLNHANIVQTFDIGHSGDTYFIVMEFVDGSNLKSMMENLRESGSQFSVELSCFIAMEICRGLAYAHGLADVEGNAVGIVHRDVSPPNVLVSKQGEVKIVDFGLAKATSQIEQTDPGVVKGKFAYLSPEAAWGKPVDLRTDVFACGVILFEMLTMERLFLGQSDIETIELVRAGGVPSMSAINSKIPSNLEQIVRKSLCVDVEQRYQSCSEFAEELAGFLFGYGKQVTSFDLQRLVRKVLTEAAIKPVAKPSIIDQLIQEELGKFSSLGDDDFEDIELDREDPTGAVPLDYSGFHKAAGADSFEDPRLWASEIGNLEDIEPPLRDQTGSGVWRESGLSHDTPINMNRSEQSSSSLAQILEGELSPSTDSGEIRLGTDPGDVSNTRNNVFLIVMFLIVALAVGGALVAYYLGLI